MVKYETAIIKKTLLKAFKFMQNMALIHVIFECNYLLQIFENVLTTGT